MHTKGFKKTWLGDVEFVGVLEEVGANAHTDLIAGFVQRSITMIQFLYRKVGHRQIKHRLTLTNKTGEQNKNIQKHKMGKKKLRMHKHCSLRIK